MSQIQPVNRYLFILVKSICAMVVMGMISGQAFSQEGTTALKSFVAAEYPDKNGPGVAVLVATGQTVGHYANSGLADLERKTSISSQSQFRMASVSKQFTARAIFQLMEEGKLSSITAIGDLFDGLPKAIQRITVGQLLQHTSGIWDYETLMPKGQSEQLLDSDILAIIRGKEETYFRPGQQFRYSNTGYCLLALIVERIAGQSYPTYVEQSMFKRAGLVNACVFAPKRVIPNRVFGYHPREGKYVFADQSLTSATKGDGGVYISTEEFAKWLDSCVIASSKNKSYLDAILANKVWVRDGIYYSMGWFLSWDSVGGMCLFHSGETTGFRNIVYVVPEAKIKLLVFSNRDDEQIGAFFEKLMATEQITVGKSLSPYSHLFEWLSHVYSGD
ncbi:serine hydrolase domain-containing protein [Sphingobacterium sp. SYP-B4668]|uniref:serine hydrolase domain-containing protein n=1 Tax=Sphingobacterium sp. SYP-B4668 TaxID=2996035 RepID=UPI0022DD4088|nr:serine hydrolase domain-containing protein [Sphingobacterium sp. SYP-B4668]